MCSDWWNNWKHRASGTFNFGVHHNWDLGEKGNWTLIFWFTVKASQSLTIPRLFVAEARGNQCYGRCKAQRENLGCVQSSPVGYKPGNGSHLPFWQQHHALTGAGPSASGRVLPMISPLHQVFSAASVSSGRFLGKAKVSTSCLRDYCERKQWDVVLSIHRQSLD